MAEVDGKKHFMEADERLGRAIELLKAAGLIDAWLFNIATAYSRTPAGDLEGFKARMDIAGEIEQLAGLRLALGRKSALLGAAIRAIRGDMLEKRLLAARLSTLDKELDQAAPHIIIYLKLEEKYAALDMHITTYMEFCREGFDGGRPENLSRLLTEPSRLSPGHVPEEGDIDAISRHYIWKDYHSPDIGDLKTRLSLIQASRRRLGTYIFAVRTERDDGGKDPGRPRR